MCSKEIARLSFFFNIWSSKMSAVRAIRHAVRWYDEVFPFSVKSVCMSKRAA